MNNIVDLDVMPYFMAQTYPLISELIQDFGGKNLK